MSHDTLNFIPDDYLEKKAQNRTNLICSGLFLIVMAGIGGAVFVNARGHDALIGREKSIDRTFRRRAKDLSQVRELKRQKKRMIQKAQVIASLLEKRPRSALLANIVELLPRGVSLSDLTLRTKRIKIHLTRMQIARDALKRKKGFKPAPRPIRRKVLLRMVGVAGAQQQVVRYIAALGHSGRFTDVKPSFTIEVKTKHAVMQRFGVDMTVLERHVQRPERPLDAASENN